MFVDNSQRRLPNANVVIRAPKYRIRPRELWFTEPMTMKRGPKATQAGTIVSNAFIWDPFSRGFLERNFIQRWNLGGADE